MNDWVSELTIEMIPEGMYRKIAEEIGVQNLIKLAELVGGVTFYIPKVDSFSRPIRNKRVKEEFNGYNHAELAQKYNFTERWVRTICGAGWSEGQLSIFEDYANDNEAFTK